MSDKTDPSAEACTNPAEGGSYIVENGERRKVEATELPQVKPPADEAPDARPHRRAKGD
jgi:hypothetical protein